MLNNFREAWGTLILAFVIFGITNGRNKAIFRPCFCDAVRGLAVLACSRLFGMSIFVRVHMQNHAHGASKSCPPCASFGVTNTP